MAKTKPLSANQAAIGIPFSLWGANYLAGTLFGFPFAYCWFGDIAAMVYYGVGMSCLYVAAIYLLYCLLKGQIMEVFLTAFAGMCIIELPRLFVYLFKVGGSCG